VNWWAPPLLRRLYARYGIREGGAEAGPRVSTPAVERSVR